MQHHPLDNPIGYGQGSVKLAMNEELLEDQRRPRAARPFAMFTADHPELDIDTAYLIQRRSVPDDLSGERLVGMKMGPTSTAKMQQMGVHDPIYGHPNRC